ncbi:MAG: hypothetical protein LBT01_09535 [Spirochaetaceae bacterium]|nr:hypothetical protein [Spirochaetaceae bacterium]
MPAGIKGTLRKHSDSEFNHEPHEQHERKTKKDMNNGPKSSKKPAQAV